MTEMIDKLFAKSLGASGDKARFLEALMAASREGHLCLQTTHKGAHTIEGIVRRYNDSYYLERNWESETQIVEAITRLWKRPAYPNDCKLDLALLPEQKEAIKAAIRGPCSIIAGGPGTGKTFLVKHLIQALKETSVLVLAPTGKAASRLRDSIGDLAPVGTIHANINKLNVDVIIVDECSMIDAALFAKLLTRIKEKTRLVLIGDPYQLPPVEAGTVFEELRRIFPTTTLTKCMRSDQTKILDLAKAVKEGDVEAVIPHLIHPNDFEINSKTTLLSAVRSGPLGVDRLNALLKTPGPSPIIITKTDYRYDLANGEVGILDNEEASFGDRIIPLSNLPPFEYAYCLSIHKSQGSEYDNVTLLLPEGSEKFGRELLYTGITRAKRSVQIVAKEEILRQVMEKTSKRHCNITERVSEFSHHQ